jgi:TfoX/Sxy family transcriptional regulator of competence genes
MAYDEGLAERLRDIFNEHPGVSEKKMFGGLAIMLHGNMCVGILGETLMARVGPNCYEEALRRPHARPMDFTGKPMRGYVFVAPEGFEEDTELATWVELCVAFVNTLASK